MRTIFLVACLLLGNSAFAFITVIDVEQNNGTTITVDSADDLAFKEFFGSGLSYRGNADEAIVLFQEMASSEFPKGLTEYEFETNSITATVSVIIKTQGTFGFEYNYFIIKKSGN